MGIINYTIPVAGTDLNSVADPEIATALQTILTWANGNVDSVNLSNLLAQSAGVNEAGQTVKGTVSIATSESRTNTAFGTLTTPDQVTGIVLPTNGLIAVWYQATWQESVSGAASATIFLGANEVQLAAQNAPSNAFRGSIGGTSAKNVPLATNGSGLVSATGGTGYTGDVTTGQMVSVFPSQSGPCYIFAGAGTYTVSVQFKASSGSVTASNRKLWVQAHSFA